MRLAPSGGDVAHISTPNTFTLREVEVKLNYIVWAETGEGQDLTTAIVILSAVLVFLRYTHIGGVHT